MSSFTSGEGCAIVADWGVEDGGVTVKIDGKGWTVKGRPRAAGLHITPLRCGWHHVELHSIERGLLQSFDTVLISNHPLLVYTSRDPWLFGAPPGLRCLELDTRASGWTITTGGVTLRPGEATELKPGAWVEVSARGRGDWAFVATAPGRYLAGPGADGLGGEWAAWAEVGGAPSRCGD